MFNKLILSLLLLFGATTVNAQAYERSIEQHRNHYKQEFLEDENSPLVKNDLKNLRFYPANSSYLVNAQFERITDSIGFDMHTHAGKNKKYVVYGKVSFNLNNQKHILFIYQSITLREKKGMEDYLFIPFSDGTNGVETFGGGRYLDFRMKDIFDHKIIIDFNKAYNPYCAYKGGYACPIPPDENKLNIRIEAGEKNFAGMIKE